MAQLYYRYGTMNSGKTIEILKVAYNYEEQGKGVVIMTSALDTRDGVGYVSSRIGMKRPAIAIEETTDIFGYRHLTLSNTYSKLNIYSNQENRSLSYSQLLWISPRAISISPLHVSPHFHF